MAVNQPNPGVYFQGLGNHVVAFRNALQALMNDAAYLNAIGGTAALEAAPFNLTAEDAQQIMSTIGTVSAANITVQSVTQFINSTEFLWGGN